MGVSFEKPDAKKLSRQAQFLVVEIARGFGEPPYHGEWQPLYNAKVESIIENMNATPSEATFYLPGTRWDADVDIHFGDKIKITYYALDSEGLSKENILFVGFVTRRLQQFSGGTAQGGKYERLGFHCLDIRWLLSTLPIYGQIGIGAGDEDDAGFPIEGKFTHFTGRRCVFNPDGLPNRFSSGITYEAKNQPCFLNPDPLDEYSIFWNWEDMARYILGPVVLQTAAEYIDLDAEEIFEAIPMTPDRADWIKIPKNISIEGLNPISALQLICKRIGWAFSLSYTKDSKQTEYAQIVLFKPGKSETKHKLYSPPAHEPGGDMNPAADAVAAGKIIVAAAQFEEDISNVVNTPYMLAAPKRVEFTAELVPAWLDSDLVPDTSDDNANLFITESDLQTIENPSQYSFFRNYHLESSAVKRDVGRIWSLNETGKYSLNTTYNRGEPFDLSTILPADYAYDENGKKAYGYYDHALLPCLSMILQNSINPLVEFSFDAGVTWHRIACAIVPMEKECGIQILEHNLSEIKPKNIETITSGDLEGIELNYFTSLAKDKLAGGEFNTWQTRVRVTASIQLEQRLHTQLLPSGSGSPFYQADVIDVSNNFFKQARHTSSQFSAANMPANERDDYEEFSEYIDKLRKTLQDTAISGRIVLDRLWLGTFNIGDSIEGIEGRDYSFKTSLGSQELYPEIVQIVYLVQKQKMQIITRDLRFSENR